jgi:hypothetical protein
MGGWSRRGRRPGRKGWRPVAFGHFRPGALLEDQFLLGQEVVGVDPVEGPDVVEDRQLLGCVEAQVADEFADVRPVLLLDVGAVVAVTGTGPGEG